MTVGVSGLLLVMRGLPTSKSLVSCTFYLRVGNRLKPFHPPECKSSGLAEICYACGEEMVQLQACKYRCEKCGAVLDCEDVSGLPI